METGQLALRAPPLTQQAHARLRAVIRPGDTVLDATVGNGKDSAVLAEAAGPQGRVYGFDIQDAALANTRRLLAELGLLDRVTLIQDSHAEIGRYARELCWPELACAVFNLGYLPGGGDKALTTARSSTLLALEAAHGLLRRGGYLSILCYPGHPAGEAETAAVKEWASRKATTSTMETIASQPSAASQNKAPILITLEKGTASSR